MALINFPQAPTVSSIYAPKDSVAQLNYMNQSNAQALNNLLNLGSKIHDYSLSRDQAGLMENPDVDPNTKSTQIAALESRKINASDPSMIWRWKAQMDATREANAAIKDSDLKNFGNKATMILSRDLPSDLGSLRAEEKELENVILEGQKLGYDVSALLERQEELKGLHEDIRFEDMQKKFYEEKAKKEEEYESEMKENTKKIIKEQLEKLKRVTSRKDYNFILSRLHKTAEKHGIDSDFNWPEPKKAPKKKIWEVEEE